MEDENERDNSTERRESTNESQELRVTSDPNQQLKDEDVSDFMDSRSPSQVPLTDKPSPVKEKDGIDVKIASIPWASNTSCPKGRDWRSALISFAGKAKNIWLTNVFVSMLTLTLVIGFAVGLGCFALLVKKPEPQIDKTVDAFHIPNHEASRNYDALQGAINDLRQYYINKNSRTKSHSHKKHKRHSSVKQRQGRSKYFGHMPKKTQVPLKDLLMVKKQGLKTHHYHRPKRDTVITQEPRYQYRLAKKLDLIYVANSIDGEEPNIFTERCLLDINRVEKMIMDHDGFVNHCYKNYGKWKLNPNLDQYNGCAPLNTLLTYFFPSYSSDGQELLAHYDSLGSLTSNISSMLDYAMSNSNFYWYTDESISSSYKVSRILRSEVHFGLPLYGYNGSNVKQQADLLQKFVLSYLEPLSQASTKNVRVLYGGHAIYDHLVKEAFWNDVRLSVFTVAFILLCMFILTSFSVWLTFWGMLSILLSFPLAFFGYRVIGKTDHLGILNGAAAFVIIGIGVDDVFVFVNTFRQSSGLKCLTSRLTHTVLTASKATFFTSFTTAAAFTANIASSIPAVHDFGLFMSLIVICCWVMVCCIMPPALNLWCQYFARCENACYQRCPGCHGNGGCLAQMRVPPEHQLFGSFEPGKTEPSSDISSSSDNAVIQFDGKTSVADDEGIVIQLPSSVSAPSDVTQLTEVEQASIPNTSQENIPQPDTHSLSSVKFTKNSDEKIISADKKCENSQDAIQRDERKSLESTQGSSDLRDSGLGSETSGEGWCRYEGHHLISYMQGFVYVFVAKPVVKYRWCILAGYLVLFAASLGIISQLKFATKPPQLFSSESNLQQLIDLSANFSHQSITCDRCSAFYRESGPSYVGEVPNPGLSLPQNTIATNTREALMVTPGTFSTRRVISSTTTSTTTRTTPTTTTTSTKSTTPFKSSPQDQSQASVSSTTPTALSTTSTTPSLPEIDPCKDNACEVSTRTSLEVGASVFVVFGIEGIDRSDVSRTKVLSEKGNVVYDPDFESNFTMGPGGRFSQSALTELCRVCKYIANRTDMVVQDSSQCIPSLRAANKGGAAVLKLVIEQIPECRNIPINRKINGKWLPSRAMAGITTDSLRWIAFAFHSTTYKGQSYFQAYEEYHKWNKLITEVKDSILSPDSPLKSIYQTSQFWPQVMMEVVAVSSAIYGLVFSLVICVGAVAVFTGHVTLLLIIMATILGVITLVLSIFHLIGWEIGAVEAVSLSILVGSSVDYCVHLVEGYLLSGHHKPPPEFTKSDAERRQWRSLASMCHIGISIISSALTTIIASIPLTQTTIVPFSKFGAIVAINMSVSIVYSLTACTAFLSIFAPARYVSNAKSMCVAFLIVSAVVCIGLVTVFVISRFGFHIPGPSGEDFFAVPL